ncbi:MAG: formate--tetrahydrofolate ligase [Xanthomonadales bacterium]|nr:formate--tetrahydrofolate ligase [Gammaproteobacteria bacterium]MBT8054398.1 formate--tetrahydrofolate ligase [Gammaproteobacteria bacterium]NND56438.1 formate--tetrahydrofolate ligase [Xanthomonadales bacterium]NNK51133.1 formate--tetrahydrofolate ligase [Xanthomonadales bacterium]
MLSDTEIAAKAKKEPIEEIAAKLGIVKEDLIPYGDGIAKVRLSAMSRPRPRPGSGKLILVSATTPTSAGEGKTTTSIGLGQAFTRLEKSVCVALREPSLGPCLGVKGGATGGGYAQVVPANRINLHFTGDFHAITTANNLISAAIDNHLYWGNELQLDPRMVVWRRVMDMNDRSLRNIVLGLGGRFQGIPREGGFDITAASEIMAILCLANDMEDLRARLNRILIGSTYGGEAIFLSDLGITDALLALLRDAVHPNLVQTLEGTPVLMHGGPFANIAHGCNSVFATRMAMHFADWAITEAGFGFDLGAEKFFDIKCRSAGLNPDAVVLVTTIRALKLHGGKDALLLEQPDVDAVSRGLENLDKHIESVAQFNKQPVVALNRFHSDSDDEIRLVQERALGHGVRFAESRHFAEGGAGATDLAREVMAAAENGSVYKPLYDLDIPVVEKVKAVSRGMYGAHDVAFTKEAEKDLRRIEDLGFSGLPICIAKAPSSLSDDPALHGRPRDFQVTVRNIQINSGAGFLVVLTGAIMRMPGLPRRPLAVDVKYRPDGTVEGFG